MLSARQTLTAQDKFALLNCRRLPGRLNTPEVALLLGFQEQDIGVLTAAKLLAPLGKTAQNAPKYFASIEVLARAGNAEWLSQATKILARHWQKKNRVGEA